MQGKSKYIFFVVVVFVCLVSDQISKQWAEHRLASPNPTIGPPQTVEIEVPQAADGMALREFLAEDLTWTDEAEIDAIARHRTRIDGQRNGNPDRLLKAGEKVTVTARSVTVNSNFFHFKYTRNPGAAFGFLSRADSPYRRPFFIGVSVIAVLVILWILRKVTWQQKMLMIALSLIVGGALGNLIDRIAYGWVIDFIDWHWYTTYRWPTFNLADAQISTGVGLMAIELLFGKQPTHEKGKDKVPPKTDKA